MDMLPLLAGQRPVRIVEDMGFMNLCQSKAQNATFITFNMGGGFLYLSDRAVLCREPGPFRFHSKVGNSALNYSWAETKDSLYMLTE